MSETLNPSEAAPAQAAATTAPAPSTPAPSTLLGGGLDQKSPFGELPEDVQKHVAKYSGVSELAKGYADLETRLSQQANVASPNTTPTTPEEWKATLSTLGLPQSAEGYDLKGVGAEQIKGYQDLAFQSGLLPHQAQGITQAMQAQAQQHAQAQQQVEEQKRKAGEEALRQDWGTAYGQKMGLAQRAIAHVNQKTGVASGELQALLEESGLGDHPVFIRTFATIGEMLAQGEGQIHGVAGSGGGFLLDTPEASQRKLAALQQDPAFMQRLNRGEEAAVAENKALHLAAYNQG